MKNFNKSAVVLLVNDVVTTNIKLEDQQIYDLVRKEIFSNFKATKTCVTFTNYYLPELVYNLIKVRRVS